MASTYPAADTVHVPLVDNERTPANTLVGAGSTSPAVSTPANEWAKDVSSALGLNDSTSSTTVSAPPTSSTAVPPAPYASGPSTTSPAGVSSGSSAPIQTTSNTIPSAIHPSASASQPNSGAGSSAPSVAIAPGRAVQVPPEAAAQHGARAAATLPVETPGASGMPGAWLPGNDQPTAQAADNALNTGASALNSAKETIADAAAAAYEKTGLQGKVDETARQTDEAVRDENVRALDEIAEGTLPDNTTKDGLPALNKLDLGSNSRPGDPIRGLAESDQVPSKATSDYPAAAGEKSSEYTSAAAATLAGAGAAVAGAAYAAKDKILGTTTTTAKQATPEATSSLPPAAPAANPTSLPAGAAPDLEALSSSDPTAVPRPPTKVSHDAQPAQGSSTVQTLYGAGGVPTVPPVPSGPPATSSLSSADSALKDDKTTGTGTATVASSATGHGIPAPLSDAPIRSQKDEAFRAGQIASARAAEQEKVGEIVHEPLPGREEKEAKVAGGGYGHARSDSASLASGSGKVGFGKKFKGEMKVVMGKLTHNVGKVEQGRSLKETGHV